MRTRAALGIAAAGLLFGCERAAPPEAGNAGAALEAAARARGLVGDPGTIAPTGAYAGETDRVCIVPREDGYTIGAAVDYGEGQGCIARGTAQRKAKLEVRLGEDCRFTATLDGDRIAFPAVLPAACDRTCRGRASLSTLSAERLSASEAEARSLPAPDGQALCG